jgi:hypothetical protein
MLRHTPRFLAVALVIACGGGSDPASPGDSVVGTYALRTINGATLPAVLGTEQGVTVSVTAGALTLRADRTFSATVTARGVGVGTDNTLTSTSAGTYSVSGNAVTLVDASDTSRLTGSYANGSVTLTEDRFVSVYTR